eukprot:COSAG02_NODE_2785_length_8032_cov_173.978066_5_plen_345_part_00
MPPPRHRRVEPALDFLEPDVAWVDRPRTTWAIPANERRRAASAATRGVLVDGAAPLRRGEHKAPQTQARDGVFADLPDELVVVVLRTQGPRALGRLARTCRRLNRIASSGLLWSELFQRRFPRAYRSRAASCTPRHIERMPWKRTYCEQIYEQWARRRYTQEQQRARERERHITEARKWCTVGGRGTQRLYNTLYSDASGNSSVTDSSRPARPEGSPLRREGATTASLDSPVLERSLGRTGSSFFMEQMAANTRQFLKPSNKKRFLKARAGERRIEEVSCRSGRSHGVGAGVVPGAGHVHGMGRRRNGAVPQGSRRHQQLSRPLSAAGPAGRPKGPSLAPPPTA